MTTKKQHYVPRFYLRHFTNADGKLHAYRRDTDSVFSTRPEGVCAENYLYEVGIENNATIEECPEFLRNCIEGQLADVESRLAPFYERLIELCEGKDFAGRDFANGRLAACYLASNLIVRHPFMLAMNRKDSSELTKTFLAEHTLADDERIALEKAGLENRLDEVSEVAIMQTLLFSGYPNVPFNRIYNAFADKRMAIFEAPVGMAFITTSLPLCFEGVNEDAYDFEVAYMPLSSKYSAVFTTDESVMQYSKVNIECVAQNNFALLAQTGLWDTAMAHTRGALEAAVLHWKIMEGGSLG